MLTNLERQKRSQKLEQQYFKPKKNDDNEDILAGLELSVGATFQVFGIVKLIFPICLFVACRDAHSVSIFKRI